MTTTPTGIRRLFQSCLPLTTAGQLARWSYVLTQVNALEPKVQRLSDAELRKASLSLRYRARCGEPLVALLPEGYALVREAGRRTLKMRHFDVQILGGIAIFHRSIVEMQTGEGKTLTATLPMYLHALAGNGALLATVNDYLAKRDAEWMMPIYHALGISVGIIQTEMQPQQRREAYHCDITYGTAKEFGFDFLKDRLLLRRIAEGQRDLIGMLLGNEVGNRPPGGCVRYSAQESAAADVAARHGNNEEALKYCRGLNDTVRLAEPRAANTKNGILFEFCFHDNELDSKWMLRHIAEGEKEGGTNPLAKVLTDAVVEFVNRQ